MKNTEFNDDEGARVDEKTRRLMRNAKIMMVDDEPINMRVLQLHLNSEGYERFVTVSDSTTAIDVLREEKPDVLLLDLQMPYVSGIDILQSIGIDKELRQIPVIVLTSSSSSDFKFKALQLGATDFLSKPVHASELALRMRNTLVSRAYEQQLKHMDALTNLPNRLFFVDHMKGSAERMLDNNSKRVLVLVNLLRFKSINDSFGSNRGDDVLWTFSQRMLQVFGSGLKTPGVESQENARESAPVVLRLGGDRFGAIVETGACPSEDKYLLECIDALLTSAEEPFVTGSRKVFVNICVGVSVFDEQINSVESAINSAETAMHHAQKSNGKSFAFYDACMVADARRLWEIENAMRTAIANGEMYLAYQPKVDVGCGVINGAEALLRWDHRTLGNVSPEEFVPVAESSGLIVSIGQWVIEQACQQAALIRASGFPDFCIAVNVSVLQLYKPEFIAGVRHALDISGLSPDGLIIEITENMIMKDVANCIEKLKLLQDLGTGISVDDFGTGYSSLSYLQSFPIDQLKIDRSFIMQIESADECAPIVNAVVSLAHDLNLNVVAEGVETETQLAYIKKLSCEQYQGYLMSRPVVAEQFMTLLQDNSRRAA